MDFKFNKNSKIYIAGHSGLIGSSFERYFDDNEYDNVIVKKRSELDLTSKEDTYKFFQEYRPEVTPVVWVIAVKLSTNFYPQGRDDVMNDMKKLNIETRPGFYPPSAMRHIYTVKDSDIPISNILGRAIICLPSSPNITNQIIDYICNSIIGLRNKI